jgi:Skp family chaperone for outer membrane proteins
MKLFTKTIAAAALAGTAAIATPAAAHVAGIATSSPEAVIVRSQARIAAYKQLDQQYAAQIGQIRTLRPEMQTLQQSLDTDSNGQLSQAELQANPGVVQQIQQKEQQLGQASQPIVLAQTYAIEQLINDYQNVRQQVVQQKNIQLLLTPDAIQWAPEAVNVTDDLVAVLDQRVPTVQITPPEGWRPRQDSLAAQQTVSQVLMNVAQQQAAQQQAQQQQPAAQPAGR